jgi:hypothetical protein
VYNLLDVEAENGVAIDLETVAPPPFRAQKSAMVADLSVHRHRASRDVHEVPRPEGRDAARRYYLAATT